VEVAEHAATSAEPTSIFAEPSCGLAEHRTVVAEARAFSAELASCVSRHPTRLRTLSAPEITSVALTVLPVMRKRCFLDVAPS
jgi:hypothetical protein